MSFLSRTSGFKNRGFTVQALTIPVSVDTWGEGPCSRRHRSPHSGPAPAHSDMENTMSLSMSWHYYCILNSTQNVTNFITLTKEETEDVIGTEIYFYPQSFKQIDIKWKTFKLRHRLYSYNIHSFTNKVLINDIKISTPLCQKSH